VEKLANTLVLLRGSGRNLIVIEELSETSLGKMAVNVEKQIQKKA
jgi:hypothetical protein